jgi:hypothetical protein
MTSSLRKFLLTTHVIASVGWLGAVLAYLVLAIAGVTTNDPRLAGAATISLELIGWYAIVPLALASVATGLIQSLSTEWGLFRHYWIATKFVLSLFATTILLVHLKTTDQGTPVIQHIVHAAGGLVILIFATALSVYKPWGMTPYGQRPRDERRTAHPTPLVSSSPIAVLPRKSMPWGKVIGVHVAILVLIAFIALHMTGGMGHN